MKDIQNIIFDLGGVLLNIDFERSQQAFQQLGISNFKEMVSMTHSNELFYALETGMDTALFYERFRAVTGTNFSNDVIEKAWCALLIQFRTKSIEHLQQLKSNYRLFLLSNTNEIHRQHFQELFRRQFSGLELTACFEAVYYSQLIGLRKPDAAAWLHVLETHQLHAAETLFIDDGLANIVAAKRLGMHTIHLLPTMRVEDLGL